MRKERRTRPVPGQVQPDAPRIDPSARQHRAVEGPCAQPLDEHAAECGQQRAQLSGAQLAASGPERSALPVGHTAGCRWRRNPAPVPRVLSGGTPQHEAASLVMLPPAKRRASTRRPMRPNSIVPSNRSSLPSGLGITRSLVALEHPAQRASTGECRPCFHATANVRARTTGPGHRARRGCGAFAWPVQASRSFANRVFAGWR